MSMTGDRWHGASHAERMAWVERQVADGLLEVKVVDGEKRYYPTDKAKNLVAKGDNNRQQD